MERIATPIFETPVQWLRVGDLQLHLFLDDARPRAQPPPPRADDRRLRRRVRGGLARARRDEWGAQLVELPSGQVQLYFRDPAGNLIELNWPDADTLDRSRYPELRRARRPHPADARVASAPSSTSSGASRDGLDDRRAAGRSVTRRARTAGAAGADRCASLGVGAARGRRRRSRALGALLRADDRQVGDRVRLGRARSEGLPDHGAERRHRRRALLRRRERVHADLRPDARRQHGARRVLPLRRLRRAQAAAPHGRRGRLVRPDERAGEPDALDRPGDRRHARRRRRWASSCSRSSCAGTRARTCARR